MGLRFEQGTQAIADLAGTYRRLERRVAQFGGGAAAATYLGFPGFTFPSPVAGTNTGGAAFYLDPADWLTGSRTLRLRMVVEVITNAVAPGRSFTFDLLPVSSWAGASGAYPTVATVGAGLYSAAPPVITTPSATSRPSATVEANFPVAGWYAPSVVIDGATAANSHLLACWAFSTRQI